MSDWLTIIKQLMAERKMSERQLCILSGVWRNTLRRFLNGKTEGNMDFLDRVLAALGYQLAAISYDEGNRTCRRSDQEFVDAVKSWNPVRDAVPSNTGPRPQGAPRSKPPVGSRRGYDSKWDKERQAYLAVHRTCVRCGAPSIIVNHIVPHKGDMELFWDRKNWEATCKPCHDGPIQREERRR